jgi:alpha-D-ribose 1-methylphosphonate 5-triphosphate synthase subunit PhnH
MAKMKIESIWQASIQQRVFRELVEAFSRPGKICDLGPYLDGATAQRAILATLIDGETTLADPHGQIAAADWPLLQVSPQAPETSRHVAADGCRPPDFQPMLGTLASPEFGATVFVEIDRLGEGGLSLEISGPGVDGRRTLQLSGLHPAWLSCRADWVSHFPLGVDLLLFDTQRIVALPRTAQIRISREAL